MSRIGIKPIAVPAGVDVKVDDANVITVKGPLGTLTQTVHPKMAVKINGAEIVVERASDEKEDKSLHGLTRTLINNMVEGVTKGFTKELEINGVGYRAQKQGKTLTLNLGHSHPITFDEDEGITFEVPNPNSIIIKGIDKQYVGEFIRRKTGKAGK